MNIADKFCNWIMHRPATKGLLLIGSRVRQSTLSRGASFDSDWDFQLITSEASLFRDERWVSDVGLERPLTYIVRSGRLRGRIKVTALWEGGELDIVIITTMEIYLLYLVVISRLWVHLEPAGEALGHLSRVWSGGVAIRKGGVWLRRLVAFVCSRPCLGRLEDAAIMDLARGFVCDYMSAVRKLKHGELLATQRWLHVQMLEVNFALLHELRLRRGEVSFPDARRAETYLSAIEIDMLSVDTDLSRQILEKSLKRCANSLLKLVEELTGRDLKLPI